MGEIILKELKGGGMNRKSWSNASGRFGRWSLLGTLKNGLRIFWSCIWVVRVRTLNHTEMYENVPGARESTIIISSPSGIPSVKPDQFSRLLRSGGACDPGL